MSELRLHLISRNTLAFYCMQGTAAGAIIRFSDNSSYHRIANNLVSQQEIGPDKQTFFLHKIVIIFLPLNLRFLLGAQKSHLIETVLLSTHNICFG